MKEAPNDHDLRFSLAYTYSENDLDNAAYYHYSILLANSSGETEWPQNNIGVAADALELVGKAVNAYKRAAGKGNAKAFGNLSYKYLQQGFFEEARKSAVDGLAIDPEDNRVTAALAEISKKENEETERERKVLDAGGTIHSFFQKYSEGLSSELPGRMERTLKVEGKEFHVEISAGRFTATRTYTRPAGIGNALIGIKAGSERTVTVKYEGDLRGRCVEATYSESGGPTGLLSASGPTSKEVLLVLDDDQQKIHELELDGGIDVVYKEWVPCNGNQNVHGRGGGAQSS